MEAANPLFDAEKRRMTQESPKVTDVGYPINHRSEKGLKIPEDTTLQKADWDMIEDDLLPFECTAILISLGGVALIGLTIHALQGNATLVPIGYGFLNGIDGGGLLILLLVIPCVVGSVQIVLAIFFSMLAAFESWQHVSCQDVIRRNLPAKMEKIAQRLPLRCTARKAYLALMWIFLIIQLIASGIAIGINKLIDDEANKGSDTSASSGLIRDVLDYSTIVFNECCATRGWSKQGFIPPCAPGTTTLVNCTLPALQSGLQSRLCTCYLTSPDTALQFQEYVNQTNLCNTMATGLVGIDPKQNIPGTDIPMRALIPSQISSIPIVGDMNTLYGCGAGFVRGYQWALTVWSLTQLQPYFVAMIIITALQIVFLIIGSTVVCRVKIIAQKTGVDEDGNIIYGETRPIKVPQGFRGLIWQERAPDGTLLLSPRLMMPKLRARSRSGSNGGFGPKIPLTPSPLSPSALGNTAEPSMATISSPEIMKLAAKHTIHQPDNFHLDEKPKPNIDSIL